MGKLDKYLIIQPAILKEMVARYQSNPDRYSFIKWTRDWLPTQMKVGRRHAGLSAEWFLLYIAKDEKVIQMINELPERGQGSTGG